MDNEEIIFLLIISTSLNLLFAIFFIWKNLQIHNKTRAEINARVDKLQFEVLTQFSHLYQELKADNSNLASEIRELRASNLLSPSRLPAKNSSSNSKRKIWRFDIAQINPQQQYNEEN